MHAKRAQRTTQTIAVITTRTIFAEKQDDLQGTTDKNT
jgi:hypothetical protein